MAEYRSLLYVSLLLFNAWVLWIMSRRLIKAWRLSREQEHYLRDVIRTIVGLVFINIPATLWTILAIGGIAKMPEDIFYPLLGMFMSVIVGGVIILMVVNRVLDKIYPVENRSSDVLEGKDHIS